MTTEELLKQIAEGRTFAERLPLYEAAMNMSLLTVQQVQAEFRAYELPKPPARKAAAKRTTKEATK